MRIMEEIIRGLVLFSLTSYIIMTCIELTLGNNDYFIAKLAVILLYICAIFARRQLKKVQRINSISNTDKVSQELYMQILKQEREK